MDEIGTRKARARDLDALVMLRAEMFRGMGTPAHDPVWQQNAREWFAARLDDPHYGIFVLEAGGGVVACAVGAIRDAAPSPAAPEGRDVLISNVSTLHSHRGCGYGRAVFEAAMEWARQSGVTRAELMATPDGRSLYSRAGFALTHFPAMRASLVDSRSH